MVTGNFLITNHQSPITNHQLPVTRHGFTFVELVFVTLVLTILVVSAMPNFRGTWRGLELARSAVEIAQMLRSARVLAITRGEPVVWQWDVTHQRMQLAALHEQEGGRVEPGPIEGRLGRARIIPGDVDVTILREEQPVEEIQFLPDGTSDTTLVLFGDPNDPSYQIEVNGSTSQVALRKS